MRAIRVVPCLFGLSLLVLFAALAPEAAEQCANRGKLDVLYCDEDGDQVADPPKDSKKLVNPDTLIFAYVPVEDPAVYTATFGDPMPHLEKATGKKVQSRRSARGGCTSPAIPRAPCPSR